MNLYLNPQLCSSFAVSMAQITAILYLPPLVILTSCVAMKTGPLLTLYPQSTTLRYFKAFNERKMFFKGCCRFPAGQQHCVHCWAVGGGVAPSSVILQWSHSSSQGLLPDRRTGDCTSSFRGCWFLIITVYGVYLIYSRMGYGTAALLRVLLWGRCGLGVQRWVTSRGGLSLFSFSS